jgi:hypothetical protein
MTKLQAHLKAPQANPQPKLLKELAKNKSDYFITLSRQLFY